MDHRTFTPSANATRRDVLLAGGMAVAAIALPIPAHSHTTTTQPQLGNKIMSFIKTSDGTEIFYKDWGPRDAQPIVFHHGWPLSADDWDAQMMSFLDKGYRVIAHDRRGHG
ncbi:MAG: alpha/beta hydrolase, partial [Rhizobium giardinii]